MAFGPLPFQATAQGKNLFGGEEVAPKWKRFVSGFIDIGIPVIIWVVAKVYDQENKDWIYGTESTYADFWGNVLPAVILLNSGLLGGTYGQSLGRFLTQTTLVIQVGRKLEVPGPLRGMTRVIIPLLFLYFAYSDFRGGDFDDSDLGGIIFSGLIFLSFGTILIDPKNRSLFDHATRCAVVNLDIRARNRGEHDNPAVRKTPF